MPSLRRAPGARRVLGVVLASTLTACGDATGPTREVALSFCPLTIWAGIQNEGQQWRTIADRARTVRVEASERLTVAVGEWEPSGGFNSFALTFYYLTREQAQATFVCPAAGPKQLSGSFAGVSDYLNSLAMGSAAVVVPPLATGFRFEGVPDGPLDLVAASAKSVIIRRGVNYPDGAAIPVLDFASAEPFALEAHRLSIQLPGVPGAAWATDIITRGGTRANLSGNRRPCCADSIIYSLPASRLESGDLHRLTVSGGGRLVELFYATPSDQTVAFGPPLNSPTFTNLGTAGQLWRMELVAQPEYGSQIELVGFTPQPSHTTTRLTIKASKEHFGGTPATWTITVPDLSGVEGFPAGLPQKHVGGGTLLRASGAPWLSPSTARAGDVYHSARTF